MYYILLNNIVEYHEDIGNVRKISEIIPEFNPTFPGIPIDQRYSEEFLAKCITSEVLVPLNWLYVVDTNEFIQSKRARAQELQELLTATRDRLLDGYEGVISQWEFNELKEQRRLWYEEMHQALGARPDPNEKMTQEIEQGMRQIRADLDYIAMAADIDI